MAPTKYDIETFQGDTFNLKLTVKDSPTTLKNLFSYSARMQIRSSYSSETATETLSTANGEIVIDVSNSNILLSLSSNRTANIYVDPSAGYPPKSLYVYDLELINGENVNKIIYGKFIVYGEVTK